MPHCYSVYFLRIKDWQTYVKTPHVVKPSLHSDDEWRDEVSQGDVEYEDVWNLPEVSTTEHRSQGDAVQENGEDGKKGQNSDENRGIHGSDGAQCSRNVGLSSQLKEINGFSIFCLGLGVK